MQKPELTIGASATASVRILFICLGNICRSPAAHAVMERMVADAGLERTVSVDSAGIGDWHVGQLPDSRMRRHGARRGYALDHRARQFKDDDFGRFDYIVVMDDDNYRIITGRAPSAAGRAKVVRMSSYFPAGCCHTSVPDPYYGGDRDFELALDLIELGCRRLLDSLIEKKQTDNHTSYGKNS